MRFASSLAAASFCLVVVASHAAAQSGDQSKTQLSAASAITAARWDARPVGIYDLEIMLPNRAMPAKLTVSDSAGTLLASLRPEGDNEAHPRMVTLKDTDLVFDAEAPRGHVQIVLQHEGDRLTGTWRMGPDGGAVRGTIAR